MLAEEFVEHEHDAQDRFRLVVRLYRMEIEFEVGQDASQVGVPKTATRKGPTYASRLAEHVPGEQERREREIGRVELDELAVEERELHEEAGEVLGPRVFERAGHAGESEPRFGTRVPDGPLDRLKDVTLHLDERLLVVRVAAHVDELWERRYAVLRVLKLGRDPERCAADELVVLLEDDPF